MIWWLVRRDLSPRVATPAMLLAVLATLAFVKAPSLVLLAGLPYCFCVWAWMPKRGTAFDAALPIRGRELFAAHYLSSLTLMVIPLVIGAAIGVVNQQLDLSIGVMLEYIAIAALATLLPYGLRPGQLSEPPLPLTVVCWAALGVVSAIIMKVLDPFMGLLLLATATIVIARELWTSLPDSLQLTGQRVVVNRPKPIVLDRLGESTSTVIPERWKAIVRSQFPAVSLFYYAFLVFSAALGSWVLVLFVVVAGIAGRVRYRLRWLEAFPLSHRKLLWLLLAPSLLVAMFCMEAGSLITTRFTGTRSQMSYHAPESSTYRNDNQNQTRVRLEYWQLLRGNPVPLIVSPWGERTVADTISIAGVTLFDPYTTAAGSSSRFVDWQFARATTAVYGHPISLAESRDGIKATPLMSHLPRMQLLNAGAVLTMALWMFWIIELGHWSLWGKLHLPRYAGAVIAALICVPAIILIVSYAPRTTEIFLPFAKKFLWSVSSALPVNLAVVAIVAALPALPMYALLEWQFARSEMTGRVPKTEP